MRDTIRRLLSWLPSGHPRPSFAVQYKNKFGAWTSDSYHESAYEAYKAKLDLPFEKWPRRVIALKRNVSYVRLVCRGWKSRNGVEIDCPTRPFEIGSCPTVEKVWEEGQEEPFPTIPQGWHTFRQCMSCHVEEKGSHAIAKPSPQELLAKVMTLCQEALVALSKE